MFAGLKSYDNNLQRFIAQKVLKILKDTAEGFNLVYMICCSRYPKAIIDGAEKLENVNRIS